MKLFYDSGHIGVKSALGFGNFPIIVPSPWARGSPAVCAASSGG